MMLRPHEMDSAIITGPINLQEKIIQELHKLKILHIVDHSKSDLADIGSPLESASRLSEMIVKVRALITSLSIKKEETKIYLKKGMLEINQTTTKLIEETNRNFEELRKTEEKLSKNLAVRQELEVLKGIDIPLHSFTKYKSLAYFTGYVKSDYNAKHLKEKLSGITEKFMLFDKALKKKTFIALFVDIKNKEDVSNTLQNLGFSTLSFTRITDLKGSASDNLTRIEKNNATLKKKSEAIKRQIDNLGQEHKGFLIAAEELLIQALEKAEAPLRFAATKDAFLIKGWIPSENLSNAVDSLNKISKGKIFIHNENAKADDKVPVKLKNPSYAKPFEFFINLYSMPTHKEFDPTFLMFLIYPIFFGFMLGDIGYGMAAFALFWFLKKKFVAGKNLFNIMLIASASSAVFGMLYGEIFGLEEIGHYELPHLLSRTHEIFAMLYISIIIGILHVNLGLILGFINEFKTHGLRKAVFEKGSWFVLQIGVALLALSSFNVIQIPSLVGIVFLMISMAMLFKGEGVKGIIELPSIFTNILSYARLMAIGLSSVSLAVVINDMASGFFHQGGFAILAGILILIIGHAINIALGLFGSFLHSLRLHYVEFFGKFFHGGAEKYKPFGLKE